MPMKKIKELFIKYKEIIMYLIFGVATTGVNWVVYSLLMKAVLVHAPGSDDVKMTVSNDCLDCCGDLCLYHQQAVGV